MVKDGFLCNDSIDVKNGKGCNVIPEAKRESLFISYLKKFKDPIIIILLIVLVFSVVVSVYEIYYQGRPLNSLLEPVGIFIAILLATGVAFIFEYNAEKEFRILNKVKDDRKVKVLRWASEKDKKAGKRAKTYIIKKMDVCLGDVVVLEPGDEVPADGVIIEDNELTVDESAFTGEPFTSKSTILKDAGDATYPSNVLLRGVIIIDGTAKMRITAVGALTEEGKGAKIEQESVSVETPLNKQLNQLARWIAHASYIIAALIVIGRLLIFFTSSTDPSTIETIEVTLSSIMIAVTLIVVAVPEGLPMSITISLALSMRKMLNQKNLVRRLHACETLGATTVICTDKTGTLTQNKMQVITSEFYIDNDDLIARSIILNSSAELAEVDGVAQTVGNPTECAILSWLHKENPSSFVIIQADNEIVERIPFSSERKFMETTIKYEGRLVSLIKGAPEILLNEMCSTVAGGVSKDEVSSHLEEYQSRGMRTLGFAVKEHGAEQGLFIGIVAIADPVRDDVKDAIDTCKNRAGIRVIMVTGDVEATACEISRQLDIIGSGAVEGDSETISGEKFRETDDALLKQEVLPHLCVMYRAKPEDKARLVTLLQEMGEVVAVTGDGTNDAPALKKAQVGLSMGDGTARAKEASDVTIIDNSFASINTGIMWGRSIYLNIKRFILFQMTINFCACLIVLVGACVGLDSPLTVTQMLWINLIMDTLAAVALSSLPADESVMDAKPRHPHSHIIDRKMTKRIIITGLFFCAILLYLWRVLWHYDINNSLLNLFNHPNRSNTGLDSYESGVFFTTFVIMQFWNLFNARYFRTKGSLIQDIYNLFVNREEFKKSMCFGCLMVSIVILVGQFLLVNCAGRFVNVAAIKPMDWLWLLLLTSPILLIPDLYRFVRNIHSA